MRSISTQQCQCFLVPVDRWRPWHSKGLRGHYEGGMYRWVGWQRGPKWARWHKEGSLQWHRHPVVSQQLQWPWRLQRGWVSAFSTHIYCHNDDGRTPKNTIILIYSKSYNSEALDSTNKISWSKMLKWAMIRFGVPTTDLVQAMMICDMPHIHVE